MSPVRQTFFPEYYTVEKRVGNFLTWRYRRALSVLYLLHVRRAQVIREKICYDMPASPLVAILVSQAKALNFLICKHPRRDYHCCPIWIPFVLGNEKLYFTWLRLYEPQNRMVYTIHHFCLPLINKSTMFLAWLFLICELFNTTATDSANVSLRSTAIIENTFLASPVGKS